MIKPVKSIDEALKLVDAFQRAPSEFELAFPDSLNDPIGMNMAIVCDRILSRGWMPDGFTQKDGFRICHYRAMNQPTRP
jgi:hypothetical protein